MELEFYVCNDQNVFKTANQSVMIIYKNKIERKRKQQRARVRKFFILQS